MTRLTLTDDGMEMMMKMFEGNPGAATALMELLQPNDIDPQSALGSLGSIFHFDELGIYGSNIYILWSDICGRNVHKVVLLTRAYQLGLVSQQRLIELSIDYPRPAPMTEDDFKELSDKVCEQLEEFKPLAIS